MLLDTQTSLESLAEEWHKLKREENAAAKSRLAVEESIIALLGKRDEGSQTTESGNYKITITGKLTRKMDWDKWEQVKSQIAPALHPVKTKLELDETGVKYLKLNEPEVYALLPIEVKPAKTSVDVKVI